MQSIFLVTGYCQASAWVEFNSQAPFYHFGLFQAFLSLYFSIFVIYDTFFSLPIHQKSHYSIALLEILH